MQKNFHSGGVIDPAKIKPFTMTPIMIDARDTLVRGLAKQAVEQVLDMAIPKGTQFELPIETKQPMRRVVIESPLSPANGYTFKSNQDYARRCMKDSLDRGEAPYASHLLYTQMLDDDLPNERKLGMEAGFLWGEAAQTVAVYTDRGMSSGMIEGIKRAQARGANIEFRSLGE
jgi:hypothetical protein